VGQSSLTQKDAAVPELVDSENAEPGQVLTMTEKTTEVKRMLTGLVRKLKAVG
jgi:hypothetical protein